MVLRRAKRVAARPVDERWEQGKSLRGTVPRDSHASVPSMASSRDPIELIESQNGQRLDWLLPVRRARMSVSPFAFYRGSANIMAADLAETPVTGLAVQACGDAHLSNFGLYASPERRLVFDVNDFDETLPGPWEWDVKRLATSFTIAARHNGLTRKEAGDVTMRVLRAYRKTMRSLARMPTTKMWYAHLKSSDLVRSAAKEGQGADARRVVAKAKSKDSRRALRSLAEEVGGTYRIKSRPPLLVPLRELRERRPDVQFESLLHDVFEQYKQSVPDDTRWLLDRFRPLDGALKVVGVGSVGTYCFVVLLVGRDLRDPLFLQIKQAGRSVLESHLPASSYDNHGRRVVEGQRLMQTVSDVFLGWIAGPDGNHYFVRQLHDWKGSVDVEKAGADDLRYYAKLCGWTLARAHARSGDPGAIAGYLGSADDFDKAVSTFARRYARQNQQDYEAFAKAIGRGRLAAADEF